MKFLYVLLFAFIAVRADEPEAVEAEAVDESLYDAATFAKEVEAKPHFIMFFAPW